ncbi:hypothetical protein KEGY108214_17570 [Kerstersia gyiorum]
MYHRHAVAQAQKILTFRCIVVVQDAALTGAAGDDGELQDGVVRKDFPQPGEIPIHAPREAAAQALLDFQVQQHQRLCTALELDTRQFVQVAAVATPARGQGTQFLVEESRRMVPVNVGMQAWPEERDAGFQQGFQRIFPVAVGIGGRVGIRSACGTIVIQRRWRMQPAGGRWLYPIAQPGLGTGLAARDRPYRLCIAGQDHASLRQMPRLSLQIGGWNPRRNGGRDRGWGRERNSGQGIR